MSKSKERKSKKAFLIFSILGLIKWSSNSTLDSVKIKAENIIFNILSLWTLFRPTNLSWIFFRSKWGPQSQNIKKQLFLLFTLMYLVCHAGAMWNPFSPKKFFDKNNFSWNIWSPGLHFNRANIIDWFLCLKIYLNIVSNNQQWSFLREKLGKNKTTVPKIT